ncbi:hypothetical protein HDU98_002836 [Podochytrium sp. JEL0797]|nr:hypothetical protein HDU98_002836 [Podochytrium sp. JEL0797]
MSRHQSSDLASPTLAHPPSLRPSGQSSNPIDYQDYIDEDEDEDMMMDDNSSDQDYDDSDAYEDEEDIDESDDDNHSTHRDSPALTSNIPPVVQQKEKDENHAQQNQVDMRKQIILIQQDSKISPQEKAKKIQVCALWGLSNLLDGVVLTGLFLDKELMTSKWSSRDKGKSTRASLASNKLEDKRQDFNTVLSADTQMTFHDKSSNVIGCKHYQRAAKLQAHCCGKWYTCRFCHDEVSDHNIIRNLITTMMCMHCSTVQPAGQDCINVDCQKRVAKYYCKECKLWDDDPRKNIYHCHDCGICRIGKGLGQDYFHCKKCNVCMAISLKGRHKCIERNLESDCPICGEYMFTSTTTVIFMPCGHCIHYKCHQEYIQTSYQCPTCFKSLANMSEYFKRIDAMLAQHQMPPEYNKTQTFVYCNDCEKKCYAKFHFLYHKCIHCKGYNTKVLQTMEMSEEATADANKALLLASETAAEAKVERANETSACCGGAAESSSTVGSESHSHLTQSHSDRSVFSNSSSLASLHGDTIGSTAPMFSSSSSSLHSGGGHHRAHAVHQQFTTFPPPPFQHPPAPQQMHSSSAPMMHRHSFSGSNTSLTGTALQQPHMNPPYQQHSNHQHQMVMPPNSMVQHQQQHQHQQYRFSLPNRSMMGPQVAQQCPHTHQQQLPPPSNDPHQHPHQQYHYGGPSAPHQNPYGPY